MWKKIEDYHYAVNEKGEVINTRTGRIVKPHLNRPNGYLQIRLSVNGVVKHYSVHRLVATYFIDNPENKPEVNHKDGNHLNNSVENLEWATHKENINHYWNELCDVVEVVVEKRVKKPRN